MASTHTELDVGFRGVGPQPRRQDRPCGRSQVDPPFLAVMFRLVRVRRLPSPIFRADVARPHDDDLTGAGPVVRWTSMIPHTTRLGTGP